jgi:hypothetical protein
MPRRVARPVLRGLRRGNAPELPDLAVRYQATVTITVINEWL